MKKTIKSKKDFEMVFHKGMTISTPYVRLKVLKTNDQGRIAVAAAKKLGCAPIRNRSKRVLREAAKNCQLPLYGYDIILFATHKTREGLKPVQQALSIALKKAIHEK